MKDIQIAGRPRSSLQGKVHCELIESKNAQRAAAIYIPPCKGRATPITPGRYQSNISTNIGTDISSMGLAPIFARASRKQQHNNIFLGFM